MHKLPMTFQPIRRARRPFNDVPAAKVVQPGEPAKQVEPEKEPVEPEKESTEDSKPPVPEIPEESKPPVPKGESASDGQSVPPKERRSRSASKSSPPS